MRCSVVRVFTFITLITQRKNKMSSFLGIKDLRFFSVEDEGMTESQTLF